MITYSVLNDINSKTLDPDKLGHEIVDAGCVTGFDGITTVGDNINISVGFVLDQVALDEIVRNHVALSLAEKQAQRIIDIDAKTRELIAEGFAFDGQKFSLSTQAQMNWITLVSCASHFAWPMNVTTLANTTYKLQAENLAGFFTAGSTVVAVAVGSGRALKIAVNAANNQSDLDAVVDTR